MYPIIRMINQFFKVRRMPRLAPMEAHVSHHYCLPWDIDIFMELNNGRTLTLFDLGRIPLAVRTGLDKQLSANKWGLTVAGVSVRYRRRIRMFERIEMISRLVSWDDRFFYIEQSMWKSDGECANQAMFRTAVTDRNGIVSPSRVAEALGVSDASPPLPPSFQAWADAENARVWPPERAVP
jgi:acyl-CoA thioesterase FadM